MGFWNILKGKTNEKVNIIETDPTCVYAPVKGEVISLKEIGDGVFSEQILGKGCGIRPSEGIVAAPFDGEVLQVAKTKHALGLKSDSGIEVLVHVGMDTVDMNGTGFTLSVRSGDRVKCGQQIMTFSLSDIEAAGHPATTAVIITNTDQYKEVSLLGTGSINRSQKLLQII